MCITTGLYFSIQSCNSSIDTAGPAGTSDNTFGHVDAILDECMNMSLQLKEILWEKMRTGRPLMRSDRKSVV